MICLFIPEKKIWFGRVGSLIRVLLISGYSAPSPHSNLDSISFRRQELETGLTPDGLLEPGDWRFFLIVESGGERFVSELVIRREEDLVVLRTKPGLEIGLDSEGDDGEEREEDEESEGDKDDWDEGEEEEDDKEEKDRPGVLVVFIRSKLSRVTELWFCAKPGTWRIHRILKHKYTDMGLGLFSHFHVRRGQINVRISNLLKKYFVLFTIFPRPP